MSLTQQFLILSLLPLAFLFLIGQIQRPQRQHRSALIWLWSVTLFLAAVWASSILSNFLGRSASVVVTYNWQFISRYAFGLMGAAILLTTTTYLGVAGRLRNLPLIFFGVLWVGAIVLDPLVGIMRFEPILLGSTMVRQFDLWASIWATSWFLPLFAAWMLTRQAHNKVPTSMYRNQVNYWFFALSGFMVGGLPALIQQRSGSGWLQMSALLQIAAATVATLSLTRERLPDLRLTLRQNLRRLFFVTLVFLLTLGGILLLTQTDMGDNVRQTLPGITLAAAGFSALIALLYRLVNKLFQRGAEVDENGGTALLPVDRLDGHLSDPQQLAQSLLVWVQQQWHTDDAWIMTVSEEGERLCLRPRTGLSDNLPEPAYFSPQSPFITHLQRNPGHPLVQYDIDTLSDFEALQSEERDTLRHWKRLLYLPLHGGATLVGVLALGMKQEQATYTPHDFARLSVLAQQIGPVFHLSQQFWTLSQTYHKETSNHQNYIERAERWEAVSRLYRQFLHLISPDIRKGFGTIESQWQRTYNEASQNESLITLSDHLTKPLAEFKVMLDRLITVSGRIQKQSEFQFADVRLDDVIRTSINSLSAMAEARRVQIKSQANSHHLPEVRGDAQRLQEALQFLLHNAIKFNKIGGQVEINYGRQDDEVYVRVTDNGVGISEDRLAVIWLGLTQLNQNTSTAVGMGLGLPLARFIIEAHGGRIEAQSHYGAGSTFTIYLPIPVADVK
jgi:signal transduction histidine kinase